MEREKDLFVLDEPSIGLHPRDMGRIVQAMQRLRDAGNTLVVVEHDPAVMLAADRLIDMGPGPGERGGQIVFDGTPETIRGADTLTGAYLGARKHVGMGLKRLVEENTPRLILEGVREHNLKDVSVEFPLQRLVVVTGVSGSGKSTLMQDVLYPALARQFGKATESPGAHERLLGADHLADAVFVGDRGIRAPFDNEGRLDEAAFRRQLGRLRDAGVCVYMAGSGSGEAYSLTKEERNRVMAIAVEELKGKVPVRAMGCEPHVVDDMVEFMQAAERAKVDAAQIFSLDIGHAAKPTFAELERYYSTIIESTSLPVYISSHKAAGYFVPIDLIELVRGKKVMVGAIDVASTTVVTTTVVVVGVTLEVPTAAAVPTSPSTATEVASRPTMAVRLLRVALINDNKRASTSSWVCPVCVASVATSSRRRATSEAASCRRNERTSTRYWCSNDRWSPAT